MVRSLSASLLVAGALLASCGADSGAQASAVDPDGETIACALNGAEGFDTRCGVERDEQGGSLFLVIRHPDGGFRRFEVVKDGRGVITADGFDEAEARVDGGILEVAVNRDRYRFPATVKSNAGQ